MDDNGIIQLYLERSEQAISETAQKYGRYWYMDSIKDIALEYGLSESKVSVTLFRTREKLKRLFDKEGIVL